MLHVAFQETTSQEMPSMNIIYFVFIPVTLVGYLLFAYLLQLHLNHSHSIRNTMTNIKHFDLAKQMKMEMVSYKAKHIHLLTDVFSRRLTSRRITSAFLTKRIIIALTSYLIISIHYWLRSCCTSLETSQNMSLKCIGLLKK